jgi:hypothetical protein
MNFTKETSYMNLVSVQKGEFNIYCSFNYYFTALFVDISKIPNNHWDICSQVLTYSSKYHDMIPIYNMLIANNISVLLYSGDADSCVSYIATQISAEVRISK